MVANKRKKKTKQDESYELELLKSNKYRSLNIWEQMRSCTGIEKEDIQKTNINTVGYRKKLIRNNEKYCWTAM